MLYGIEYPVHMTVAASDGESIWVFRYPTLYGLDIRWGSVHAGLRGGVAR